MEIENKKTSALGSNLVLGLLVTLLSIFTALANYSTYKAGNEASDLKAEGDRQLANSNTEYISASQFIIVDYNMYDNYYVNDGVDGDKAEYYQSQFSDDLTASVSRDNPFDDQYYDAMYKDASDLFDEAFNTFDRAKVLDDKEGGFQFAMLISAVGLSFAAYASLLDEANRLRSVFAILSVIALVVGVAQYIIVAMG
jgi:hypothetical protein